MAQKTVEQKPSPSGGTKTGSRTAHHVNGTTASQSVADAEVKAGELTFITDEGEHIIFPDMEMPLGEATAIASEETLSKIWNRSSEDQAWHDI